MALVVTMFYMGVNKSEQGKGVSNSIEPRFLILLGSGAFVGPVRSNLMSTLPGSTSASVTMPSTPQLGQNTVKGLESPVDVVDAPHVSQVSSAIGQVA